MQENINKNINISITDGAASQIRKAMQKESKPNAGLRISGTFSACCGLRYALDLEDAPREGDIVQESNGIKIFISEYIAHTLNGAEIDYAESSGGSGFVIKSSPKCANGAC